ncbi:ATP-dependent RNA helicase DDX1-like [Centruroides sculpturatus]|uniref:ATP-dependent RNA helicase DDX1-like n=1 Tax=Centruroides sculpturatus TaxID=218467 RepID=UPI000C6CB7EC|nr:ATP-dependent RNA helicase DDX1-like [Centruroides sculpturatus]
MTAFEEMGVMPEIGKAVDEMEWSLPTDVQAEAVPLILGGGDVLMAAETGSGKTGAFCLPILQIVWETLKDEQTGKTKKDGISGGGIGNKWTMSFFDRGNALGKFFRSQIDIRLITQILSIIYFITIILSHLFNYVNASIGKYYYEAKVTDEGLCRVGWSTLAATLDLGTDKQGFGFGGTGKKSFGKQFDDYGNDFGEAFKIPQNLRRSAFFAAVVLKNAEMEFNFGDSAFKYKPEAGYIGLSQAPKDYVVNSTVTGNDFGEAFKIPQNLRRSAFFAAVVLKNAEMEFNFGDSAFKYKPEAGYIGLSQAPKDYVVNSTVTGASQGVQKKMKNAPQAIIIEPSRELAEQTLQCIRNFKKYLENPEVRELLVIGGVAAKDQISALQSGVDIIVGTPGRLEDLISTGQISLTQVRFFVLDEADGLLSQGYGDLINRIHQQIPKITSDGKRLQMVVCSATLHSFEVKKLAEKLMHFPTWVDLKGEDSVPETVHHVVCMVDPRKDTLWTNLKRHVQTDGVHDNDHVRPGNNTPETLSEAVKLLKGEYTVRAINEHKMDQGIIFCRTKLDCDNMENYLNQIGGGARNKNHFYSCVCLHGDRKPQERKGNLEKFKRGEVKFLICTDVAARGIDVKGIPFVINVTLPDEKANYVHRIGRVGRAERMGLALSFASAVPEKVWYHSNCSSKGRNCWNTRLTDEGGCCIWYNEPQYLADIEEHLNCTIQQIDVDLKVPLDEFDGKVTYGEKRKQVGSLFETHTAQMAPTVKDLAALEKQAQSIYLTRYIIKDQPALR